MSYQIIQGDNRETLKTIPDNSIDAIVTDPPYGIDFLGKSWDANTGALETYQECLRVLKPGGHILAFSAARTYHHLAVTLEQAGFEIRDQIMWIYSSGFPKAQQVKGFEGWKNGGLKPGHEPIALARKPTKLSIEKNMHLHGVGALNIDATRVAIEGADTRSGGSNGVSRLTFGEGITSNEDSFVAYEANDKGRFPSNVIGEIPLYQKYFYCPKVSRKERHIGFDENSKGANIDANTHGKTPFCDDCQKTFNGSNDHSACDPALKTFKEKRNQNAPDGNNHPTVKPIELMKYLIKLITPPGGTVLDPFNGSGSTGCAAVELGHPYIGCELDPAYVEIANKRIAAWTKKDEPPASPVFNELFE